MFGSRTFPDYVADSFPGRRNSPTGKHVLPDVRVAVVDTGFLELKRRFPGVASIRASCLSVRIEFLCIQGQPLPTTSVGKSTGNVSKPSSKNI